MKDKQLYLFGFKEKDGKDNQRHKVVLPLDILILLGVIIVILLTFTFSLGVERGKRVAFSAAKLNLSSETETDTAQGEVVEETATKEEVTQIKEEDKLSEKAAVDPVPENNEAAEEKGRYNIQVASFLKESTALKEADTLENMGYPVSVAKKGKYAVVYVGSFKSKEEAKSKLKSLKEKYKDCLLRRL